MPSTNLCHLLTCVLYLSMSPTDLCHFLEVSLTPLWDKHELCSKSWTSCVNRNLVHYFCTYSSFSTLYIPVCYTIYTFSTCFNKNIPWVIQHVGMLRYLGEDVMVCAWGHHFSLCKKGWPQHPLWHFYSEWLLPLSWPGTCIDYPTENDYDIIGALCDDVPMM